MSAKKTARTDVVDFEKAMAELEETVRKLEAGDAPLDESLAAFEKGVALVRTLHSRLDAVQARIEELTGGRDGATLSRPFATDDDAEEDAEG